MLKRIRIKRVSNEKVLRKNEKKNSFLESQRKLIIIEYIIGYIMRKKGLENFALKGHKEGKRNIWKIGN